MKRSGKQTTFGRGAHLRSALLKNLLSSLLEHGSITTTLPKERLLRTRAEGLLTQAKRELSLHTRRELLRQLGHARELDWLTEAAKKQPAGKAGVRLTKLAKRRGDDAVLVKIDLLTYD